MLGLLILFFFKGTSTPQLYTLSLHDALPIFISAAPTSRIRAIAISVATRIDRVLFCRKPPPDRAPLDRKSTRLNSSHMSISYAVFCLKKKKLRELIIEHFFS